MQKVYLTTTLPYVNGEPHMGHAFEFIQADVIARYYRAQGYEVFFNFGVDEHGKKIYDKAIEAGKDPQVYVDEWAGRFDALKVALNFSYTNFIRTTDPHHVSAAQKFWRRCSAAGDIYKKQYKIKYCVGCELEKQESDLEDGKCPVHPSLIPEIIDEENYFFRFSKYQDRLLELYRNTPEFVIPATRLGEVRAFVERGLADFSISRLKSKMPWGIPVPDDENQVMYVWFDALVNYISAIGWPDRMEEFYSWWPVIQFAGKDNLRQQAAIWQAMLMSAGLPSSKQIMIHGFITGGGGVRMSKTLGNVINPFDIVRDYGTDALRYYLLREVTPFEDGDFTMELFKTAYNANLANGLGNLVSRIMKMSEEYLAGESRVPRTKLPTRLTEVTVFLDQYEFKKAFDVVFDSIQKLDQKIQESKPFSVWKTDQDAARKIVRELVTELADISFLLGAFMPETSEKIAHCIKENKKPDQPLFLRRE